MNSRELLALTAVGCILLGCGHEPQVGDVYAEYADNRTDEYALTNGLVTEMICIHKVIATSNGMVYCAVFSLPITNRNEYPFPYNEYGPASNFRKYKQYRTRVLVRPNPQSKPTNSTKANEPQHD